MSVNRSIIQCFRWRDSSSVILIGMSWFSCCSFWHTLRSKRRVARCINGSFDGTRPVDDHVSNQRVKMAGAVGLLL